MLLFSSPLDFLPQPVGLARWLVSPVALPSLSAPWGTLPGQKAPGRVGPRSVRAAPGVYDLPGCARLGCGRCCRAARWILSRNPAWRRPAGHPGAPADWRAGKDVVPPACVCLFP